MIARFATCCYVHPTAAFLDVVVTLHFMKPQDQNVTNVADSLRMNLRQVKHALTIRDEETRKLRAAVTHLESTLSQRERELRDTVRCYTTL